MSENSEDSVPKDENVVDLIPHHIDKSKVKTIEDVINIISGLGIAIHLPENGEPLPGGVYEDIKKYFKPAKS